MQAPLADRAHSLSIAPDSTPEVPDHAASTSRVGPTKDTPQRTTLASTAGQTQYLDALSEPSLGADPGYMDEEEFVPPDNNSPDSTTERSSHQRTASHAFAEPQDEPASDRQLFNLDYESFWRSKGHLGERFNSWPTIRGRTFDLFDLWKAATSQPVDPAERDWEVVAEKLGFDWVQLDGVEHELAHYFEEHLGVFEAEMVDYDDGSESTEEDENGDESVEEDESFATPEPEVPGEQSGRDVVDEGALGPSRQPFNSSPPKLSSLKRTQGAASLAYPEAEPKRRRVDRSTEIPSMPDHKNGTTSLAYPMEPRRRRFDRSTEISSTPDHKNGTAHLRKSSVSAAVSPSDRKFSTLPRSSRSPAATRRPMGSPLVPEARKAVAEPETQDFHYDAQTQNVVPYSHPSAADRSKGQPEADITAAQQRTLESEGLVEVISSPRTFKKARGAAHNSPLRRQLAQDPFLDSPDNQPTPKPQFGKGRNPLLPPRVPTATNKRRSLPWSRDGEAGPEPKPAEQPAPGPAEQPALGPVAATVRPKFIRPPGSDELSSPAARGARTPGAQADSPDADAAPIPASCDPREIKYLREVLREWERRGYARDVALRGLDATTWAADIISDDVIKRLERGKAIPENWWGVWTEADDRYLAIADYREPDPPNIDAERYERRVQRAKDRLARKFDANCMRDRRHWLSMKHALQEANIQL